MFFKNLNKVFLCTVYPCAGSAVLHKSREDEMKRESSSNFHKFARCLLGLGLSHPLESPRVSLRKKNKKTGQVGLVGSLENLHKLPPPPSSPPLGRSGDRGQKIKQA